MPFTPLQEETPTESRFTPISTEKFTSIEESYPVVIGKSAIKGAFMAGPNVVTSVQNIMEKSVSARANPLIPVGADYDDLGAFRKAFGAIGDLLTPATGESKGKALAADISEGVGTVAATFGAGGVPAYLAQRAVAKTEQGVEAGKPLSLSVGVGGLTAATDYIALAIPAKVVAAPAINLLGKIVLGGALNIGAQVTKTGLQMATLDRAFGVRYSGPEYEVALYKAAAQGGVLTIAQVWKNASPAAKKILKKERFVGSGSTESAAAQGAPKGGPLAPAPPAGALQALAAPGTSDIVPSIPLSTPPDTLGQAIKQMKDAGSEPDKPTQEGEVSTQGVTEKPVESVKEPPKSKFTPIKEDVTLKSSQEFEEKSGVYTVSNEKPLIEMPELVELTRSINEGKSPIVKEKLRNALGKLTSKPGTLGEADISLRADIFAGDLIGQREVKPKEANSEFVFFKQEVIEAAEEAGLDTDNIIFRKERNKSTGKVELKAYQKNPQLAPNVMSHEIGHLIDYLPDKDIKRGNVLGRIKVLKKHLVQTIDALPTDPSKVLTPKEKSKLRRQAAKSAGPRPDKESAEFKAWQDTARGGYQVLLRNEITARGLITRNEVMAELKNVSQTRKPFDATRDPNYTKYRYSAPELYADAISAYITTPEMFKNTAPKFRKSFEAYLGNKPDVRTKLGELVGRGQGSREALVDTRIDKLYNMMGEGNKARQELNERNLQDEEGIRDTLMRGLIDKYHSSLKQIRLQEKRGGDIGKNARQARFDLEETAYIASEAENYFFNLDKDIIKAAESQGSSSEDIGLYMFANRVAKERGEIANPLGHTKESATEVLEALPQRWGAQRYNATVKAVADFNTMRNDLILSRVEASGLFTPELIETIKNNPDYAKFSVHKFLTEKFGGGTTSKIYKQIGTLSEVENPFIATVMQDISLIRAAAINTSKRGLVDTMQQTPDIIYQAEMKWSSDRKTRVPVEPKNPKQAVLTMMVEGKPQNFYVSKAIADTYTFAPFEATRIARVWATINAPVRAILVNKNPLWMARNVVKDLRATIKNNPEVRLRDVPKLLSDYRAAFGEAWKDVMRGEKSADIQELLSQRALLTDRAYETREQTFDDELDRLANQFSIVAETESTNAYSKLKKGWDFLDKLGKVSERTGKVAGFKYLKNRTDLSAGEIAHRVRTRIGTPDVKRQGAWQSITNNIFMFSNVNKEGIRASYESYKEDKGAYIWKTIATNMLPKLALAGMTYAALRSDDDELKRMYANIPERDMKNYTTIPMFLTEDGKTVYLRIPEDYQGQLFGALAWDGAHGNLVGKDSAISSIAEASPYQLNPLMDVGLDLINYYVLGNNPQNSFTGRPVIPNLAYQTGGPEANKAMAKHVWTSLGGNAIYRPSYNIVRDQSSINKILSAPPFNVLGAFVRISDRGTSEKYYKTLAEERQGKAKDSLARQRAIVNGVNNGLDNDAILDKLDTLDLFSSNAISQTRKYRALKLDNPEVNAYAQARSNKEKQLLEKEFRKTMNEEEVDNIIDTWLEWESDDGTQ